MNFDEQIARACEPVPGLLHAALTLLPDPSQPNADAPWFVEHLFVGREELVVILQGRRYPQLALALRCTAEPNLAFVRSLSRTALDGIEATVDFTAWGL